MSKQSPIPIAFFSPAYFIWQRFASHFCVDCLRGRNSLPEMAKWPTVCESHISCPRSKFFSAV